MFKLHQQHLTDIQAAANHFGEIHFHGDGNIYHKKEDSDFRKDFSNDNDGPQTYRILVKKGDEPITSLEDLQKKLLAAKTAEAIEKSRPKEQGSTSNFKTTVAPVAAEKKVETKK